MATIILVDDEQDILDPLEEMLGSENFRVRTFLEPHKALSFLRSNSADLAVFDIKMPEMNGFQLLQEARNLHPNLPVIFLSSKTEEQDQIIGFTLGADDFVTFALHKRGGQQLKCLICWPLWRPVDLIIWIHT